jgi:large subunit ribosomal protein L19e
MMFMNSSTQKKLAAKVMKVGISRVRILDQKSVEEAITRNDIKRLISHGAITVVNKRGASKKYSGYRLSQKKKGRRSGKGSCKGRKFSRKDSKTHWMDKVRSLRRLLRQLRNEGKLKVNDYRKLYYMVKGGAFRNKNHLLYYLKSKELIESKEKKTSKEKGAKNEKKS